MTVLTGVRAVGSHASHLDVAFERDTNKLLLRARARLGGVNYDTIVCTGLSGTMMGPVFWRGLDVPYLAVVRKQEVPASHSSFSVEGKVGARWIFVDDFISSGATLNRVQEKVREHVDRYGGLTEYMGTYEYIRGNFRR